MRLFKPKTQILEEKKVKKVLSVLGLALMLVGASAAVALADNSHYNTGKDSDYWLTSSQLNVVTGYDSTTSTYTNGTASTLSPTNTGTTANAANYIPSSGNVHSNYAANTDACAACHSPHYSQDNATLDLLQAASPSQLCITCHDGTVAATYNVMAGTFVGSDTQTTYRNNAGLFAEAYDGTGNSSSSMHDVFAGVQLAAAPGGKNASTTGTSVNGLTDVATAWSSTLDCVSCHDPHDAGGNPRLLNPDPNGIMAKVTGITINSAAGTNTYGSADKGVTKYYFTNSTVDTAVLPTYTTNLELQKELATLTVPMGAPYSNKPTVYVGGTKTNSWNFGYDQTQKSFYVTVTDATLTGPVTVDYYPVLVVKGSVTGTLTSGEKETGFNNTMSAFCGACHVSFVGGRGTGTLSGMFTGDAHHNSDISNAKPASYYGWNAEGNCLTCHTVHGVDNQWWTDETRSGLNSHGVYGTSLAGIYSANTNGTVAPAAAADATNAAAIAAADAASNPFASGEMAGDSAIKRLPNMGVCESCHQKGVIQGSVNNIYNN